MKLLLPLVILLAGYPALSQPVAEKPAFHYRGYESTAGIPWQNIIPSGSKLVISAEVHEVSVNADYFFSLFEYLSRNGYRNIILEAPFSMGFLCNEYLATGNDSLLGVFCRTEESARLWKKLHTLNDSLPAGEKMRILAIDFELDGGTRKEIFSAAVQYLIGKCGKEPPAAIAEPAAQLSNAKSIAELRYLKNQLANALEDTAVQSFLDSNYVTFQLLVTRNDRFGTGRDKMMFDNFMQLYQLLPPEIQAGKFYAQFGWGHARKSNDGCLGALFHRDENSPFRFHTFFIGTQYINCYSTLPDNNHVKSENSGVINDTRLQKQLELACSNDNLPVKQIDDVSDKWHKESDALIMFCNFGGTAFLKK